MQGGAHNFEKLKQNKTKNRFDDDVKEDTDEPASIYPTSTAVQRLLYIFLEVHDYERWRETKRERRKESKTQPGFALFGISRAAQQPGEKGYIISVHLRPESTMAPKHTVGALETHPAPTVGP